MEDVKKLENLHISEVPEQYRPYSCTELTNKQIEFARHFLDETEETRNKYLRRIRRFIDRELEVYSDLEDIHLLAFLRRNKFDFKQTCLSMKNGAEFIEKNREYLNRIDTEIVHRVIESKAIGFLPYRDAKGRALIFMTSENWNPDDLKAEDIIFGVLVALHSSIENPANQISGFVIIVDSKSFCLRQFREIISWVLFIVNSTQHCSPVIVREIHILHTPSLILYGWNIMYPFLDEYIRKIVIFHNSENWESLHDKIPPCILPEEVGGLLGPFSNDHWARDIPLIRKKFFDTFHKALTK